MLRTIIASASYGAALLTAGFAPALADIQTGRPPDPIVAAAAATEAPAPLVNLPAPPSLTPYPTATPEPTPEATPEPAPAYVAPVATVIVTAVRSVPTRAPAPDPVVRAERYYEAGDVEAAIRQVMPAELDNVMVAIAVCESGLRTGAVNPSSGATGSFQMLGHGPVPADAYGQAVQALELYHEAQSYGMAGLSPWYSSRACWGG